MFAHTHITVLIREHERKTHLYHDEQGMEIPHDNGRIFFKRDPIGRGYAAKSGNALTVQAAHLFINRIVQPFCGWLFYRRIGGTLFKVRVYTGSGYADTPNEKISRLICNEMMTGGGKYDMMDSSQMSQPLEGSSKRTTGRVETTE